MVSVWAGTGGYLDDVPVDDVTRFEDEFLDFLQRSHDGDLRVDQGDAALLTDDTAAALKDAIEEFRRGFEIGGGRGSSARTTRSQAEPMDEEDIDRETVIRYRRHRHRAGLRPGEGRACGSTASRRPAADPVDPVHCQDHPRPGADRGLADHQSAAAGRATPAPYAREITHAVEAAVSRSAQIDHPIIREPERSQRSRDPDHHQRPGFAERLQRQRPARGAGPARGCSVSAASTR